MLSSGKSSRLYKRLVYDDQVATDVSAAVDGREISGQFMITATAKPGENSLKIEKAVDEELATISWRKDPRPKNSNEPKRAE